MDVITRRRIALTACTGLLLGAAGFLVPSGAPDPHVFGLSDGNGRASGLLTDSGTNELVDFSILGHPGDENIASTDALVSLTAGPPGARVRPTPAPSPSPATQPPAIPQCDPNRLPGSGNSGIGTTESSEAVQQVFLPAYQVQCPTYAPGFRFAGADESQAIPQTLGANNRFAFVGLNRALTFNEWQGYNDDGNLFGPNGGISLRTGFVLQFPVDVEPLLVAYHLPTYCTGGQEVALGSRALSAIYLGAITRWDDPAIHALQPNDYNVHLAGCRLTILVARDQGPSSELFMDWLGKRTPIWKAFQHPQLPGQPDLSGTWPPTSPAACIVTGSAAVAQCVAAHPGAIGYGRYRDIRAAGLPAAQVDNAGGHFGSLDPSSGTQVDYSQGTRPLTGCELAAATDPVVPAQPASAAQDWSQASLTDWVEGYPICGFDFFTTTQAPCQYRLSTSLQAWLVSSLSDWTQDTRLVPAGYAPIPGNSAALLSVQGESLRESVRDAIQLVLC